MVYVLSGKETERVKQKRCVSGTGKTLHISAELSYYNANEFRKETEMSRTFSIVMSFALLMLCGAVAGAEPDMQDGLWEITTKVDMPGMPVAMPPMKHTQCLTRKDYVPQKQEQGEECKMVENKVAGNTVTWKVKCRDKKSTYEGNGKITYSGKSFDGVVKMTVNDPSEGTMQMTQHMSGKRIGNCK